MSENKQRNVDFSRKCRDRVNYFFQKLKNLLKSDVRYHQMADWTRFEILERAIECLKRINGDFTIDNQLQVDSDARRGMNNKQLCQLYRTRLNSAFANLRSQIEKVKNSEVEEFRLFSRAGLLEATLFVLENKIEKNEKIRENRKRSIPADFEVDQSPNKIPSLNNSIGTASPSDSPKPLQSYQLPSIANNMYMQPLQQLQPVQPVLPSIHFRLAYLQLLQARALQQQQQQSQTVKSEIWRPF